jgi:hypothetical protein
LEAAVKNRVRAVFPLVLILAGVLAVAAVAPAATKSCMKFSGAVVLTYPNPPTIVIHIIKGKVNAATVFTMTPTTTYTVNGQPATFGDVMLGDYATICAVEQLPNGTLLASWVNVTGP